MAIFTQEELQRMWDEAESLNPEGVAIYATPFTSSRGSGSTSAVPQLMGLSKRPSFMFLQVRVSPLTHTTTNQKPCLEKAGFVHVTAYSLMDADNGREITFPSKEEEVDHVRHSAMG